MKVFISGDTFNHDVIGIVQNLGHEAVVDPNSLNGRSVEGVLKQNMNEADAVFFFEPSDYKVGIDDHYYAIRLGKPCVTYILGDECTFTVPAEIEDKCPTERYSTFIEIEMDADSRLKEFQLNIESEASVSKERRQ